MKEFNLETSYKLFEEARTLVPNGIFGPRNPNFMVPGEYPCFFREGYMGHAVDVDGNEYIDYMCAFGANLLGYRHPKVDEAVKDQMSRGGLMTMPMDRWVELARLITETTPSADWVIFAKNGSDVTSWCVNAARVISGRTKILMAEGAYHGFHAWCVPMPTGIPDEHRSGIVTFKYNDLESLRAAVAENKGELAAIILTPMKHEVFSDIEMPVPGFYDEVRRLCDDEGMLFIMDDIRCCYRLKYEGSHEYFGADPDLVTVGKGIANLYPISVAYGKAKHLADATQVYHSGTHFYSAVPMAAAIATLDIIRTEGVIERVNTIGTMLKDGILEQATAHGLEVNYSGPPAIPYMTFAGDSSFQWNRIFCGAAVRRGVFLHPHHNWFICAGHTEEDIKKTLAVTDECFKILKSQI